MRKIFYALSLMGVMLSTNLLHAEGTPELNPDSLNVNGSQSYAGLNFAAGGYQYTSPAETKIKVRINNPTDERVYLGMKQDGSKDTIYCRILDPNGVIVMPETMFANGFAPGPGYIRYYRNGNLGPIPIAGPSGYSPLTYIPSSGAISGDYTVEFRIVKGTKTRFFDITVGDVSGGTPVAVNGRVWSYRWDLTTANFQDPFEGEMYVYHPDSIVYKFAAPGLKGADFSLGFNQNGVTSTADFIENRKSRDGVFPLSAAFPVFLNDPDPNIYESATTRGEIIQDAINRCAPMDVKFKFEVTKSAFLEVLIDLEGADGIFSSGTEDILLYGKSTSAGVIDVVWDGNDGLGGSISEGFNFDIYVKAFFGESHYPAIDVEQNCDGFIVNVIRPSGLTSPNRLYWDNRILDSLRDNTGALWDVTPPILNLKGTPMTTQQWITTGPPSATCGGTDNEQSMGNGNVVNTWWFGDRQNYTYNYTHPDYLITDAGMDQSMLCAAAPAMLNGSVNYSGGGGYPFFKWQSTGTGTFVPTDTVAFPEYYPSTADSLAGSVLLTLRPQYSCGTPVDTTYLSFSTASCAGTFPVELGNFDATLKKDWVYLNWSTLHEINCSHFVVERARNNTVPFEPIGLVNAVGNSSVKENYQFLDTTLTYDNAKSAFYRLKIVDLDGSYAFSNTKDVNIGEVAHSILVHPYPQPSSGELYIDYKFSIYPHATLLLSDVMGKVWVKEVLHAQEGVSTLKYDLKHLPRGMYFLTCYSNGESVSRTILLD